LILGKIFTKETLTTLVKVFKPKVPVPYDLKSYIK